MVAGQIEVRGRQSLVDVLLVPRPMTRLVMLCVAVSLGELMWRFLSIELLAYASGISAPFCLLCASAVWSMRDKSNDALSGDHLNSSAFARARAAAAALRSKILLRAALVALCALFALGPAVSNQLIGPIWHWMVLLGALGVSEAAYAYLIAAAWEDELFALRDRQLQEQKEQQERDALIARIEGSRREPSPATQVS